MNTKLRRSAWFVVPVLLIIAALVVPGCAPEEAPPSAAPPSAVEAKWDKVTFYTMPSLSGPYAPMHAPIVSGMLDYVEWLNGQGGIDGVPLEVEMRDVVTKVDNAIAAYNEWRELDPKPLCINTIHSAMSEALKVRFEEDEIVSLSTSGSGPSMYPVPANGPWVFCHIQLYEDLFGLFVDWLAETQPKPVKLAVLTWQGAFGEAILTDETRAYCKAKGVELVAEELFGVTDPDTTTQLIRIRDSGATWVYSNIQLPGPPVILKSASELGLLDEMNFAATVWGCDYGTAIYAAGLAEGMVGPSCFASWDETDIPIIAALNETFEKKGRKPEEKSIAYLAPWQILEIFRWGVEQAIADVGWEGLSTRAVRDAWLTAKDVDLGICRLTYSADRPTLVQSRIVKIVGTDLEPITDWMVAPDLRAPEFK